VTADLTALLRYLRRRGYTTTRTRSGHWRIYAPDGRLIAITGSTPSDFRALRNLRATVKRSARIRQAAIARKASK